MSKPRKVKLSDKISDKVQLTFRDIELEYQLMGYIARVNPSSARVVRPEWFSDELLRELCVVVQENRSKCTRALLAQLVKERYRKEDPELIDECLDTVFSAEIDEIDAGGGMALIDAVTRLYESRTIAIRMGEMLSDLRHFDLAEAKKELKRLSRPIGLSGIDEGYYLEDYDLRVEEMLDREKKAKEDQGVGIPTGIPAFDRVSGGTMPGEFAVIAGTTSVGKTTAIADFGIEAWMHGYNVLLVSGEEVKQALQFRIDSNLAGINGMKFRKAELTEDDYKKWDSTIQRYKTTNGDAILYVASFSRDFTTDHIENVIIRLEETTGKKIDWLGVDYLNIMQSSTSKGEDRDWQSQSNVVWDLKALTQERNLVTWTANQVKDDAYEKDLYELSDLKYARAISETAPIVVGLVRTDTDVLAGRMKMQVMKMRGGELPGRAFVLHPDMSTMRIDKGTQTGMKSLSDIGKQERTKTVRQKKHASKPKSK